MPDHRSDHDYLFSLIDYLFSKHGIHFFISSKDFDTLYSWWEKKIPEILIMESIDRVVQRRRKKGKQIDSFMNFSYEVRKNLGIRFDLNINSGAGAGVQTPKEAVNDFLAHLHPGVRFLENDFRKVSKSTPSERTKILAGIYDELIGKYKDDEEMLIRTQLFMNNLPEAMKKPEIQRKFSINYLNRRFGIPDFDEHEEE